MNETENSETEEIEDDDEPCCYGWVTSRGQVHEIDCPEFDGW